MTREPARDTREDETRLELMVPAQVYGALRRAPIAYLPLGALEWHGYHAPVGLDGLTAHGLALRLAQRRGGIVFPPDYFGLWSSLGHNPWTFLAEDDEAWIGQRLALLTRLEAQGVRLAFVISGHFASRQLAALERLAVTWATKPRAMRLAWRAVSQLPNPPCPPDHGGAFETGLLAGLRPELLTLSELPPRTEEAAADPVERRDPRHPLFGIVGTDPRHTGDATFTALVDVMVDWLERELEDVRQGELTPQSGRETGNEGVSSGVIDNGVRGRSSDLSDIPGCLEPSGQRARAADS